MYEYNNRYVILSFNGRRTRIRVSENSNQDRTKSKMGRVYEVKSRKSIVKHIICHEEAMMIERTQSQNTTNEESSPIPTLSLEEAIILGAPKRLVVSIIYLFILIVFLDWNRSYMLWPHSHITIEHWL